MGGGRSGADDDEEEEGEEQAGEQADEQAYADRLDNPQCVGKIHVIISTVCDPYFDWQTEGLLYSHYVTGMRGTITRIVSCSNPNYPYPKRWHPCFDVHTLKDMSGQVTCNVQRACVCACLRDCCARVCGVLSQTPWAHDAEVQRRVWGAEEVDEMHGGVDVSCR